MIGDAIDDHRISSEATDDSSHVREQVGSNVSLQRGSAVFGRKHDVY